MKVLDLFCGEGGAATGYYRAGHEVTGVDNDPVRLDVFPYRKVQDDAITYLLAHGHEYEFIHASPPCWAYSRGTIGLPDRLTRYERLIDVTREALQVVGIPYVIENVHGARHELHNPIMLCGRMFNLGATDDDGTLLVLDRHRMFETSPDITLTPPPHPKHYRWQQVAGVYGGARRDKDEARYLRKGGYVPPNIDVLRELIGCDYMTEQGLFLSIPPAYTEWISSQL